MKILVTDGNSRPALAICRSLGSKGHEVIIGDSKPCNLASVSRYCSDKCIYPDPASQPEAFISFLRDYIEYKGIEILIPVTDITTIPLTENMHLLPENCILPFARHQSIRRAADKVDIVSLSQSLGVDVPRFRIVQQPSDVSESDLDFDYPVVLKPAHSRVMTETGWLYTSVTYAESYQDMRQQLEALDKRVFPLLIQERVNGPGLGIFMCYQYGKPVAAFSHKRIREKPPSGGVSVLRESTELNPLALEFSEKLLNALNWNGVAMVEFKIDKRDGRPKLMEINGRFWGSLQLAIDAGVDFPSLLVRSTQEDIPTNYDYKLGIRTRWFWGDFDALLLRLLKSNRALQLPPGSPGKLRYLLDFLKFWQPGLHYEVFRLKDFRPWIFESFQWLKSNFR